MGKINNKIEKFHSPFGKWTIWSHANADSGGSIARDHLLISGYTQCIIGKARKINEEFYVRHRSTTFALSTKRSMERFIERTSR